MERSTAIDPLPVSMLAPSLPGGVPLEDRDGVYIHSFICNDCNVRFNVYSWQADRHAVATVTCPECGQHGGRFRHFLACINEAATLSGAARHEIYGHCPHPRSRLMADSVLLDVD